MPAHTPGGKRLGAPARPTCGLLSKQGMQLMTCWRINEQQKNTEPGGGGQPLSQPLSTGPAQNPSTLFRGSGQEHHQQAYYHTSS